MAKVKRNNEENWWDDDTNLSQIDRAFDPKDISVDLRHFSLDLILTKISNNEIDLFPDFQRKADLWNNVIKSQLIESILLNFPIPAFYFDSSSFENWRVIDGLQRLWTLKSFVIDNAFKLTGLSVLTELNGNTYRSLERQYQRKILEFPIVTFIIRPGTPRFAVYDIFRRLNTNGITLNFQEIRYALNPNAAKFLNELSNVIVFKEMTKSKSKRMEDSELVLRFIAFLLTPYYEYKPPMAVFLDKTMESINQIEKNKQDEITKVFKNSLELSKRLLGQNAFSKKSISNSYRRFNKALFEVWTSTLARLSDNERNCLGKNHQTLLDLYEDLLNDKGFLESISNYTTSKKAVLIRFDNMSQLIRKAL